MHKTIRAIFGVLFFVCLFCQMGVQAQTAKEDTNKVNALNGKVPVLINSNLDSAMLFASQALQLSERMKWKLGIGKSYLSHGLAFWAKRDFDRSLEYFTKALSVCDELDATGKNSKSETGNLRSATLSNLGILHVNKGEYVKALDCYFKALKITEDNGLSSASILGNIGDVYTIQKDYPKALDYCSRTLKMAEGLNDKNMQSGVLTGLGNICFFQEDYAKSLDYYLRALKLVEELGNKRQTAVNLGNIGNAYAAKGDSRNSIAYYNKALKIGRERGDKIEVARNLINIGYSYIYLDNLKESEKLLKEGLVLFTEVGSLEGIRETSGHLCELYSKKGDWKKAFDYYVQCVDAGDSINNVEKAMEQTRLEMNFEFRKKEALAKIEQEKKNALSEAEIEKHKIVRNFSVGSAFAVLSLGGVVFYNFRKRRRLESQQALSNERLRLSRELHDDIGSTLGSIAIYSDVARNRSIKNENPAEVLSKIGNASRELIEKMSDIVWSLNPENETIEQLLNRMEAFAAMTFAPLGIAVEFKVNDGLKTLPLTSEQRKNIFLIYKEAVYNIVKYADCKSVLVALTRSGNKMFLVIQDDGKGFEMDNASAYNGNGIKNMKARATDMKGTLAINSQKDKGTFVELILDV